MSDHKDKYKRLLEDAPGGGVLPDAYRPADTDDVPEGRACRNCVFFQPTTEQAGWCDWWEANVSAEFYCDAWQGDEVLDGGVRSTPTVEATPVKPRSEGSKVEFRTVTGEVRAEGAGNTFVGYAAMFNSPSQPLPFVERIAPGAFRRTLQARRDVRMYVNHDSNLVLASKRSGTLRLSEDSVGLRVEADLPETSYSSDLRALMQSGVVDRMSFGFTVPRGGDAWSDDGSMRTLHEVVLHEVSVVTGFPAYESTSAAVRSMAALSNRTGMDVDELAEALEKLADGDDMQGQAARLIGMLQPLAAGEDDDAAGSGEVVNVLLKQHQLKKALW